MAPLFQPGIAEGVEGLVFGCDGGLAGAAVDLVNGGGAGAASRHQGSDASFHNQLNSITGLVLKELRRAPRKGTLNANLSISQLEMAVRVAHTVDECWGALVETSRGFGFSEASLEFGELRFSAQLAEADPAGCWDLRIPLNHSGQVYLRIPLHSKQPPATIGRFVTSVGTVFADKLAAFPVQSAAPAADGAERRERKSLAASSG